MTITKARRAELEAELLQTMDRLDALKVELREAQSENREQVKLHQQKLLEIRGILSGREGDQVAIPGTETGLVKPPKRAPARKLLPGLGPDTCGNVGLDNSRCQLAAGHDGSHEAAGSNGHRVTWVTKATSRPVRAKAAAARQVVADAIEKAVDGIVKRARAGEITRWAADARARKVPVFVIEMTGLFTKAEVVAKYGDMCVFEKGKPCPQPLGKRPGDPKPKRKRTVYAPDDADIDVKTGLPTHGPNGTKCPKSGGDWRACPTCVAEVSRAKTTPVSETEVASIPWTELEDAAHGGSHAQIGGTEWRVLEVMPDRLVLESKSARERAWHKEGVFASMAKVEAAVRAKADMAALANQCGACGIAADQPSPGCLECDHPPKKGHRPDPCAECDADSYALVDGRPLCHPCYEKVAGIGQAVARG